MGRIYGLKGEPGARDARGCRVFTACGAKIPFMVRVELDADADEGLATVALIPTDAGGSPLIDPDAGVACHVTVRTWVRVVAKGAPDPAPAPKAVLFRNGDGSISWHEKDPLPDEAVAALNAGAAAAQG